MVSNPAVEKSAHCHQLCRHRSTPYIANATTFTLKLGAIDRLPANSLYSFNLSQNDWHCSIHVQGRQILPKCSTRGQLSENYSAKLTAIRHSITMKLQLYRDLHFASYISYWRLYCSLRNAKIVPLLHKRCRPGPLCDGMFNPDKILATQRKGSSLFANNCMVLWLLHNSLGSTHQTGPREHLYKQSQSRHQGSSLKGGRLDEQMHCTE